MIQLSHIHFNQFNIQNHSTLLLFNFRDLNINNVIFLIEKLCNCFSIQLQAMKSLWRINITQILSFH